MIGPLRNISAYTSSCRSDSSSVLVKLVFFAVIATVAIYWKNRNTLQYRYGYVVVCGGVCGGDAYVFGPLHSARGARVFGLYRRYSALGAYQPRCQAQRAAGCI